MSGIERDKHEEGKDQCMHAQDMHTEYAVCKCTNKCCAELRQIS